MSKFTTDAITLKSYELGESDKIVVMYSKDKGLLRCVAKGAKKISKSGSMIDNLVAKKFLISKGKKLDVISQSDGINPFAALRKDFSKLSYAMYCSDVVNAFAIEDDTDSKEMYTLFYGVLSAINESQSLPNVLLCVLKFQLNLMEILGYGIELDECVRCFNTPCGSIYFDENSGGIVCSDCNPDYSSHSMNPKLVGFIKKISATDFSNEYFKDKEIKNELTVRFCFNLMKGYITQKSPKKLKAQELLEIAQ